MDAPIRLAMLYSSPLIWQDEKGQIHPIELLDFKREKDIISKSLMQTGISIEIRSDFATADNFRAMVLLGCQALHFSGHGLPGVLAFEDGRGGAHLIEADLLRELFEAGGPSGIQMVFVSACHSRQIGEAFVKAGVEHVVAVRLEEPVYDLAAANFARAFYQALAARKTVQQAFDSGRAAVKTTPHLHDTAFEAEKFLLLPEYGKHDVAIFSAAKKGDFTDSSPSDKPNNLPSKPAHFVGRSKIMQEIVSDLLDYRLVTIRGGPGIGKTALAIEAGHYINERALFDDGVFFVELRDSRSAEAVRFSIANALGVEAREDKDLFKVLHDRKCLIILDNCEDPLHHMPSEFRKFLANLLQGAEDVKLLLTSRHALGAGIPGVTEKIHHLRQLDPLSAERLFVRLAPRRLNDPELSALDGHPIFSLLSGHPHAIALTAPLLQDKSLDQLYDLVKLQKVDALVVPDIPADELDATRSFAISLQISVDYMQQRNPEAVRLFAVMGLLPAGALSADLDAIWGEGWRPLMDALVRACLVERDELAIGEHFFTYPFVTSYAEKLLRKDDRPRFSEIIAKHMGNASRLIYDEIRKKDAIIAKSIFALEEMNLWACLENDRIVVEKQKEKDLLPASIVATYLSQILLMIDRADDGIQAAEKGLAACRSSKDALGEANTLFALGNLKMRRCDLDGAMLDYQNALKIYRDIEKKLGEANTLQALADLKMRRDDLEGAMLDYQNALTIFRDIEEKMGEANTLQALGDLKMRRDDLEGAMLDYQNALKIYRDIEEKLGEANTLLALGNLKMRRYDLDGAMLDYQNALKIYRDIEKTLGEANTLQALGDLKMRRDDLEGIMLDCQNALNIYRDIDLKLGEANTLRVLGDLKMRRDDLDGAMLDYQEALKIYRDIEEKLGEANTLKALADLKMRRDDLEGALTDYQNALKIYRDIDSKLGEANTLKALGDLKMRRQDLDGAMLDYQNALTIFREIEEKIGEADTLQAIEELKKKRS